MKRILRKGLGAALALAMTAGLLSGCTEFAAAYDPIKEAMGYPGSTVMLTVNGNDVTASDLLFWMAQNADQVQTYYTAMGETEVDWASSMDSESTMGDYVKDEAKRMATLYSVVSAKAEENGYSFTSEDEAAYEEELTQAKTSLGGDESYENWLRSMCLTQNAMKKMSSVGVLFNHMQEGMFREGSENAPTPEELSAYAEGQDLLCAKHILLLTQDMNTGEYLSEEEQAEKRKTAEDLLSQLKAVTDQKELETKFDELMTANSEDTGLATNPDGYTFTSGQMVTEFEEATRALEFGQISDIVESDYGFHIILRLDPAQSEQVLESWAGEKMDEMLDEWVESAEVTETEAFTQLETSDFFQKLTAYRETLEPAETAETAEEETEEVEEAIPPEISEDGQTEADATPDAAPAADGADTADEADKTDEADKADDATQTDDADKADETDTADEAAE